MTIFLVGFNHKTAGIATREKFSSEKIITSLAHHFSTLFSEFLLLATCNRTEIYVVTENEKAALKEITDLFEDITPYVYKNNEAVKHLYVVASGMDSMVIGESEILGQLKKAYKAAVETQTVGVVLHQLFREAIRVGKKTHHETTIGTDVTSIAHAAVLLAKQQIDLRKSKVIVIGAGIMAQRVVKNLQQEGISSITIVNRTYEKAQELASQYSVYAASYEQLKKILESTDLVISATASQTYILDALMIKHCMLKKKSLSLLLIDLAVPRDIDPEVNEIDGVHLFDLDGIQALVQRNVLLRKDGYSQAEQIIEIATESFEDWLTARETVSVVVALQNKAALVQRTELMRAFRKLESMQLTTHDKRIITLLSHRVTNKLLGKPIRNMKRRLPEQKRKQYLEVLKELFEIEELGD